MEVAEQNLATRRAVLRGAGALAIGAAMPARAAGYPDHAIRIVVPFAPGGPSDIAARLMAKPLVQTLAVSVYVENHAGAGSNIGTSYVARATPDGYTLLVTSSAFVVNPGLYKQVPYDPVKSFAPIAELVTSPNVFLATPASGIKSMADLVAKAKATPGGLNYASPGIGTTPMLAAEWLKSITGISMTHIPYDGAGPAMQAILAGTVPVVCAALPGAHPSILNGSVTALAVTGAQRWYDLPKVPTMVELGYKDFVSDTFHGMYAPAGTSPEIVQRLTKASLDVLHDQAFHETLRAQGYEVIANGPDGLRRRIDREVPMYKKLIADAHIERM